MSEQLDVAAIQQAFTFAADTVKQLLTFSTAILSITITFLTQKPKTRAPNRLLGASWFAHFLSIACGIWALYALTGSIDSIADVSISDASIDERTAALPSINDTNVTVPSLLQLVTFAIGTLLILIFGLLSLREDGPQVPSASEEAPLSPALSPEVAPPPSPTAGSR